MIGNGWAGRVARMTLVTVMILGALSGLPAAASAAHPAASGAPGARGTAGAAALGPNIANLVNGAARANAGGGSAPSAAGLSRQELLLYQTQYAAKKGPGGHGGGASARRGGLSAAGVRPKPAAPRRAHVLSSAARARLASAYGALPTAFELNQGQTDPRVAFLARGAGATLFLTAHDAVLSLPSASVAGPGPKGPWQGRTLKGLRGSNALRTLQSSSLKGLSGVDAARTRQSLRGVAPSQTLQGPSLPWSFRARPTASARSTTPTAPAAPPAVVRFGLLGTNPHTRVVGLDKLPGVVNYYLGDDPRRWRTRVPTYAEVSYRAVYKGVDLVYHGRQGQLEYDFDVAAGADPSAIALLIEGGTAPRLDRAGNLVVGAGAGAQVLHEKPVAYQTIDGARRPVTVRYLLQGGTTARGYRVGFAVGRYDPRRALVIDPVLYYSTYLGGSNYSYANGLAVDSGGRAYVAGQTASSDFPTSNAFQKNNGGTYDAFVSVFQPGGTNLAYSTYLGGGGQDGATGIAVDDNTVNGSPAHNAYITGYTTSPGGSTDPQYDFPIRGNGYEKTNCYCLSAFVAELQADGTLVASTFLHSTSTNVSSNEGTSNSTAIALSPLSDRYNLPSIYVAGETNSAHFPTTSDAFQATNPEGTGSTGFAAELSPDLSTLNYGAYIGGAGGRDEPYGVAVSGNYIYLTGDTTSPTFYNTFGNAAQARCRNTTYSGGHSCVSNGYQTTYNGNGNANNGNGDLEAFVAKIATGTPNCDHGEGYCPTFSATYLGAVSTEQAIATDGGTVFVTGTGDSSYPLQNPTLSGGGSNGQDAVFTALDNNLGSLIYSTFLGDDGSTGADGIALGPSNDGVYVAGKFLQAQSARQAGSTYNFGGDGNCSGGYYDIAQINTYASNPLVATYCLDAKHSGRYQDHVALDALGNIYYAGASQSESFPVKNAYQANRNKGPNGLALNAVVAKIGEAPTVTGLSVPGFPKAGGPLSGGTTLTITGHHLFNYPGDASPYNSLTGVTFNGITATAVNVVSDSEITLTTPAASSPGTADVQVVNEGGTSAITTTDQFTYVLTPTVGGVSPNAGPPAGGTIVTITGTSFSGATQVTLGGAPISYTVQDDSTISATIPATSATSVSTADLRVTTQGGLSAVQQPADQFTYYPAPTVSDLSPRVGPARGGDTLLITGTGFVPASQPGSNTVTVGGARHHRLGQRHAAECADPALVQRRPRRGRGDHAGRP